MNTFDGSEWLRSGLGTPDPLPTMIKHRIVPEVLVDWIGGALLKY